MIKGAGYLFSVICFAASAAGVYASDSLFSQAQKLYSQGSFEAAAKIYSGLCPQLSAKEKAACQLREVKALAETQKSEALAIADEKLLNILSMAEPSDTLYSEFNAESAKLQIMLGQPARAIRSWNSAQMSASTDNFSELFVLCQDIVSAYPESALKMENCNKIKPADANLISLPRKKIVPLANLAAAKPAAASQPVAQSSKWYAQLGAFGSRENAEKLVAEFKQKGTQLYIAEVTTDRKFFAVRTGTFATREEAESFAEQNIAPTHKDYRIFHN